jgi:uncharacterized protein (TIRG00374 family)
MPTASGHLLELRALTDSAEPPAQAVSPGRSRRTRSSRLRRAWPAIKIVIILSALGIAAYALSGKTTELTGIGGYLDHLRWWWLVVAMGAELLSYAALSSLQRRLMQAGSVDVPPAKMMGVTLASQAIQYTFPGGFVFFLTYLWRQFRRWGADDVLASWVIAAFNIVTFVALAVLSAGGLAMAFGNGSTFNLVGVIGGFAVAAAVFVVVVKSRRRLLPHVTKAVGLSQRLFRWPHADRPAQELVSSWAAELSAVSPSRQTWIRASILGMAFWVADVCCLAIAFYAVGVGVPWRGLLLAYGAGQLAQSLPITPGGLGAVEGSLTIALEYFGGGGTESTVAAVLLYRLVSFWAIIPIGWGAWGRVTWTYRRQRRQGDPHPMATRVQAEAGS